VRGQLAALREGLLRGLGTSEATRAMKASGVIVTFVVRSLHRRLSAMQMVSAAQAGGA
jgi:hypothetical protein